MMMPIPMYEKYKKILSFPLPIASIVPVSVSVPRISVVVMMRSLRTIGLLCIRQKLIQTERIVVHVLFELNRS